MPVIVACRRRSEWPEGPEGGTTPPETCAACGAAVWVSPGTRRVQAGLGPAVTMTWHCDPCALIAMEIASKTIGLGIITPHFSEEPEP